jgi:hypothetical protein
VKKLIEAFPMFFCNIRKFSHLKSHKSIVDGCPLEASGTEHCSGREYVFKVMGSTTILWVKVQMLRYVI